MENETIYHLTKEDVQTVALEIIDRELSDEEIINITDLIAEKIPWYDAIAEAIKEREIY
jgi:hypothetical protein